MFARIKAAYARWVASVEANAATAEEINRRMREHFGLDEPPALPAPEVAKLAGGEFAESNGNGRHKGKVKA